MADRLKNFAKNLKTNNLGGFIVSNPTNIFYLCGFRGISPAERETILVISSLTSTATLITPRLYQKEARAVRDKGSIKVKIVPQRDQMIEEVKKLLSQIHPWGEKNPHPRGVIIGFEENDLKFSEYRDLQKATSSQGSGPTLKATKNLIEDLRVIKTTEEIRKITKAQIITQKAFEKIIKLIRVGQTEEEIAEKLTKIIKSAGGQGLAFEPIVASGPNSGLPHHVTSDRRLAINDILLFDFGAKYQDYCADLSRTVFIGKARDHHRNIYRHVQEAQLQALTKIRHGIKLSQAYHLANNYFIRHKLDHYFLHGLGHGIGLEVHEAPYLRSTANDQRLTNGMVFSVEPGLYFPWGGMRIEDLVVIRNGRAQTLGKSVNRLITI